MDWARNLEANVSWVEGDSKARIVEEMTEEWHVIRLDGGNKGGELFSCVEVGHMAGSCPRNACSRNGDVRFKGKKWISVGRGIGKCFGCGEEGHYVAQCRRHSQECVFPAGKLDICHYSVENVPCVLIAKSWVIQRYHAKNQDS